MSKLEKSGLLVFYALLLALAGVFVAYGAILFLLEWFARVKTHSASQIKKICNQLQL